MGVDLRMGDTFEQCRHWLFSYDSVCNANKLWFSRLDTTLQAWLFSLLFGLALECTIM